jgi:hypothetical protein
VERKSERARACEKERGARNVCEPKGVAVCCFCFDERHGSSERERERENRKQLGRVCQTPHTSSHGEIDSFFEEATAAAKC